ncbi:MAG TPA: TIGR03118 family protein [Tepidisphaeraceae bacterium]|nr:TIGR03118 family protein [Tepidisphaeraceae bacterium]
MAYLGRSKASLVAAAAVVGLAGSAALAGTDFYKQVNLVSDGSIAGTTGDPDLVNPWGVAFAPGGEFWISDNVSNNISLYDGAGNKFAPSIPVSGNAMGGAAPTGQVYNGTGEFGGSLFILSGEGGAINGWNGSGNATTLIDNSTSGTVYKGLAIGNSGGKNLIYASDFNHGVVSVYGGDLKAATLAAGAFTDANLPAGYAPFNVQNINGNIYVTYALQDAAKHDDIAGAGHGFVDVFGADGTFMQRLISGGALDSPWGIAMAPANFGKFSNDLLVGNFGDGKINAFNPTSGALLGTLSDNNGKPIVLGDLWAITFGGGGLDGATNQLFFTAGVSEESHGLFGHLDAAASGGQAVPLPNMLYVLPVALALAGVSAKRLRAREA